MKSRYDFSIAVVGKYAGKVPREHRVLERPSTSSMKWRNRSVLGMAGNRNPIDVIVEKAREIVLGAMDSRTLTLPIDPFKLAECLSIKINPRADVRDARTVCSPNGKPMIEYNPSRPRTRIRFSICHELAHTLFPDCLEQIRNRSFHSEVSAVDNELEMLCNLAAAEFLLPIGSVQEDISKLRLSIDTAIDLRLKYEASVEAVLLRLAGLSGIDCAVFAAVAESDSSASRHILEYVKPSGSWDLGLERGSYLPQDTVANECVAIGFTAKSNEEWVPGREKFKIEMVGVSPYPNRVKPRIVGLIRPLGSDQNDSSPINIVRGDVLLPRGEGHKIIAHIVNDQTPNWGAGFGKSLRSKWPDAQRNFVRAFGMLKGPKLGRTNASPVTDDITTFQMICQHGYGESIRPRLRYGALQQALENLREEAKRLKASVHMPRIGTGEAGGSWGIIANLITEELCSKGVSVTVYDLPNKRLPVKEQSSLFDATLIHR